MTYRSPTDHPISIAILGYDGVQALDIVGPLEAFAEVRISGRPGYAVKLVGLSGRRFTSETGITFEADPADDTIVFDTIIVPGGAGLREADTLAAASRWVQHHAARARRIVSVCTGAYALAAAGLLDGRRATTHWRFADDLARRYPAIRFDCDAIFVKDGRLYTSAGITAGIDLTLALAEEDYGPQAALAVAREMVMFLKRPGGQTQFSQPLAMQLKGGDRFADLIAWMSAHPRADQTVEALAARVSMSVRNFSRAFTGRFGQTPARYAEGLRIAAARGRLESGRDPIGVIAADLGFSSDDAFARAFLRGVGVRPGEYRDRFPTGGVQETRSLAGSVMTAEAGSLLGA